MEIETEIAPMKVHEQQLALVAQHTDNGVVITDAEGKIEWVNASFTRMTGYTLEEAIGQKPGRLLQGPKSDPKAVLQMRDGIRHGAGFKAELINYAKGGREYWVEIEAMPIHGPDGELTGFFSIERDLTADRTADKVVADARRLFLAQMQAIDRVQGRIEFAVDGEIVDVNENFAHVLGYEVHELIGVNHRALMAMQLEETKEYEDFWEALKQGKVQLGEYRLIAKDGSDRWIYGTYSPVVDELGNVKRVVKYAIDQTDRRHLEERLARAQKLESIGQMAAGIAHEINTPMQFVGDNIEYLSECSKKLFRVVDGYQEMLDDSQMPRTWEERKKQMRELTESCRFERIRSQIPAAIEESREGVRRTIEIVRAMKAFSHPGAREFQPTCLNDLVEGAVAISRNRWKYTAETQLELDPNLPDAPMLVSEINQVLLNLIVNAGDAIAEKNAGSEDKQGKISIRTRSDENWVMIEVEDDGCGIPDEIQQRVFDPFFTTKEVGKGTGQGLSITHNVIVNQHQGEIEIDSSPGAGTIFTVKLPRQASREAPEVTNWNLAAESAF